uniref:putative bifunctional diguanylate cyclase/phosphodiesterase n=1 Tax=Acetatifactor sp. TaxID=1872090 RepID=UPI004056D3E2
MKELHYQLDLLKAMNQKLSAKEKMYQMITDSVSSAYLYYSVEKKENIMLGRWHDFFDFEIHGAKDLEKLFDTVEEEYALPLRDAFYPEQKGESSVSLECRLKNSKTWLLFSVNILCDENGNPTDKMARIDDITKSKEQNEELKYMAYYDDLTGLYNRNYFVRLLEGFINKAKEMNNIVSVMIIDIDDFRKVNDGLGIVVGDELVQQFGAFLNEFSEENIIVCHMNSDVYCMAIYEPIGNRSVENIHKRIQRRTKKAFRLIGGQELQISVSIGVAEYPEAAQSALDLINCAEIVMFKGKDLGKDTIQYFNAPILEDFLQSVEIEHKLKEAINNKAFTLNYQPQYYSGNRKMRGVEALIRWQDAPGHFVSPAVFIPLAEKNGMITAIGNWVVEESVRQYSLWRKEYGVDFMLSINISARQYRQEEFVSELIRVLNKYQVEPYLIELEITESILIDDFEMVSEKLQILKDYGVKISLDDFGTGFSSLSYLKKLPIDTLKIDKSFIDTVLSDSTTRVITESIINMVKALGFESIAEGVEEEQQYKYLHAIGCDTIQGYLLGKPQPPEQLETLIQRTL